MCATSAFALLTVRRSTQNITLATHNYHNIWDASSITSPDDECTRNALFQRMKLASDDGILHRKIPFMNRIDAQRDGLVDDFNLRDMCVCEYERGRRSALLVARRFGGLTLCSIRIAWLRRKIIQLLDALW